MAENKFSTGSSVPTTVISIFLLLLLSRARIMRGLLLKRYAVLLKRYASITQKVRQHYSKGTPALLKRYASITQKVRSSLLKRYANNFCFPQAECEKLTGVCNEEKRCQIFI